MTAQLLTACWRLVTQLHSSQVVTDRTAPTTTTSLSLNWHRNTLTNSQLGWNVKIGNIIIREVMIHQISETITITISSISASINITLQNITCRINLLQFNRITFYFYINF